jgi:hypothetical protein
MTAPDEDHKPEDAPDGAGETGALAAASSDGSGSDPLAPLNAVTEDDD